MKIVSKQELLLDKRAPQAQPLATLSTTLSAWAKTVPCKAVSCLLGALQRRKVCVLHLSFPNTLHPA